MPDTDATFENNGLSFPSKLNRKRLKSEEKNFCFYCSDAIDQLGRVQKPQLQRKFVCSFFGRYVVPITRRFGLTPPLWQPMKPTRRPV